MCLSVIKDWLLQHVFNCGRRRRELGLPTASAGKGEAHLLLEMGRQDFGCVFLTVFCTMALKLNCVSSMSVAGLGYVVTAAVVLSAVVSA